MTLVGRAIRLAILASAATLFDTARPIQTICAFSLIAFVLTDALIPLCGPVFLKKGLSGRDLNKIGRMRARHADDVRMRAGTWGPQ